MPITVIPSGGVATTIDPLKYTPISDTWTVHSYGIGYAVLRADNGSGSAISALVQGEFLDSTGGLLSAPYMFGGIAPNNDANQYAQVIPGQYNVTTTMPNQQAPLVNYVYCDGYYLVEVLSVIDDNNIVVKDTSGITQTFTNATIRGFSSNSYSLRNVSVYNSTGSSCNIFLPGQMPQVLNDGKIDIDPNNYGECSPVMVQCTNQSTILTYNE